MNSTTTRPQFNGPRELPATLPECELLEEDLCRDSIRLECQLGIAKGKSQADGEYADPAWYHKASAALKHIRRDRQRLAVHMKQLRIEARRADPHWQSRDQALIRALREELPEGRFEQIVEEVELNIQAGISQ
ncbi:hypothetical protein M5G25_19085 [Pseudomonas sp. TNT2022 ID357]|uniref:Uncharacterized protein n=1 Tax=Pseudomonas idahonensis TaxID=2942628 RepID=A0ABT5Q875_9PSED|nr:hypothetical protein [Pseudomonas idahonensis]MDD1150387.1 hypothetical protein [Pseudomonas idahonensis]